MTPPPPTVSRKKLWRFQTSFELTRGYFPKYKQLNCSFLKSFPLLFFWYYLKAVVRPRTKLQEARLRVEGEPLDVDFAIRFENGRRIPAWKEKVGELRQFKSPIRELSRKFFFLVPFDVAVVVQDGFGHCSHDVLPIGAIINRIKRGEKKNFKTGLMACRLLLLNTLFFNDWCMCVSSVES